MNARLTQTASLFLVSLFLVVGSSAGQTIGLWIKDGEVAINGKVIPAEDLPKSLDIEGVDFMVTSKGRSKFKIKINGKYYGVTRDGIASSNWLGPTHFTIRQSGQNWELVNHGGGDARLGALPRFGWTEEFSAFTEDDVTEALGELEGLAEELKTHSDRISQMAEQSVDTTEIRYALRAAHEAMYGAAVSIPAYVRIAEVEQYLTGLLGADDSLYTQVQNEWRLEQQAAALAGYIRVMPEGSERDERTNELKQLLNEIFEIKQENRQREIAQLENELVELEKRRREREDARERLIDARLNELLGIRR